MLCTVYCWVKQQCVSVCKIQHDFSSLRADCLPAKYAITVKVTSFMTTSIAWTRMKLFEK